MLVFSQSGITKIQYALELKTLPDEGTLARHIVKFDKKINEFSEEDGRLFGLGLNSISLAINKKILFFYHSDFIQLKEGKK
jgi:hypothetical protein